MVPKPLLSAVSTFSDNRRGQAVRKLALFCRRSAGFRGVAKSSAGGICVFCKRASIQNFLQALVKQSLSASAGQTFSRRSDSFYAVSGVRREKMRLYVAEVPSMVLLPKFGVLSFSGKYLRAVRSFKKDRAALNNFACSRGKSARMRPLCRNLCIEKPR